MKDNFSIQSKVYAFYRPEYPEELVKFIISQCSNKKRAWDCGTGNGQFAKLLSVYFTEVYATDLSCKQLDEAVQRPNIYYSAGVAGQDDLKESDFDLISVAQAFHWFDFDLFYKEVNEKLNDNGIIALISYGLFRTENKIDLIIDKFYSETLKSYWDKERKYIDEEYLTIPFPFDEITSPKFSIKTQWNIEHLTGFLNSWSAVQHYIKQNGDNPIDEKFIKTIKEVWGEDDIRDITFPVYLRIGKK